MTTAEIERRKDDFQYWLFDMSNVLEKYIKDFEDHNKETLDCSLDSLLVLENHILNTFSSIQELKEETNKFKYDDITRYLGETIRKNVGGKWELDIENEKSAYYKLPVLVEDSNNSTVVCPHKLITASIGRKKGDFLHTVLKNLIENQKVA